jgi:pimeloyl-ACP methyl ester carboxylesterase
MSFRREFFFIPGDYIDRDSDTKMLGAMYVERLKPEHVTFPYPLVFFHGAGQTAVNWVQTPDGRPGWASYFVDRGFTVYLVDQPARGRSAHVAGKNGGIRNFSVEEVEKRFTACRELGDWPQARKHSQWPGRGQRGDAAFDQFYASQVSFLADEQETQTLVQKAGAALLDRIGPTVLVTHSQGGAFGWLLADARPALVKAIAAVEPSGPPMHKERVWGPTAIRLTYDPPAEKPTDLMVTRQSKAEGPDLNPCWLQQEPARTLPNLSNIPVLIMISQASYNAAYDHCTASYLTQAGVQVEIMRLEEVGTRGNGHMMMLEMNNLDIAGRIAEWIAKAVSPDQGK